MSSSGPLMPPEVYKEMHEGCVERELKLRDHSRQLTIFLKQICEQSRLIPHELLTTDLDRTIRDARTYLYEADAI